MIKAIALGLIAFAAACFGVALSRRWAEKLEILDHPNDRSSHTSPTPHVGGISIVVVTVSGWIFHNSTSTDYWPILPYVVGSLVIAGVSWLDDLWTLPTFVRLVVHGGCAGLAILSFGYWHTSSLPFLNQLGLGWVGLPLTFLWIVGLTNAYNFMDGVDGIAGLQAVVVGVGWVLLGWLGNQPHLSAMGSLIAGASLGFLVHNWPPARVFMGDVGSAFLGYTFAVLPLMTAHVPHGDSRLALVGALLLWPFVFDTAFTFVRRALKGENVFSAHRSHLYQRLVIKGHTHRFVTLLYGSLAIAGLGLGIAWWRQLTGTSGAILTLMPLFCLSLWIYVMHCERRLGSIDTSNRDENSGE
jgi:UDP-N-acetylmuramyl pentapeptide phosphotransferase/UDP-N-acetylglucosamine-1-phosphate transferase